MHVSFWNYLGSAVAHVGFTSAPVAWHDGVEIVSLGGIMHDRDSSPRMEEETYIENERRGLERRTPSPSWHWIPEAVQAGTLQAMVSLQEERAGASAGRSSQPPSSSVLIREEYLVGLLSDFAGHVVWLPDRSQLRIMTP